MAQNNTPKIKNEEMYAYLIETGNTPFKQEKLENDVIVNGVLNTMLKTLDDKEDKELKNKLTKILEIRRVLFGTENPSKPTEELRYDFNVKTVTDSSGNTIEELTDPFGRKFYSETKNGKTTVYDSTGNVAEYQGKPLEDIYSSHYDWYLSQAHAGMSNEVITQTKSDLEKRQFPPTTYIKDREDAIRQAIETKQTEKWEGKINDSQSNGGTEFVIGQGNAKIKGAHLTVKQEGGIDFEMDNGQTEATFTNVYGGSFAIKHDTSNGGKYVVSWRENGVDVSKEFANSQQLAKMLVAGLEKMEKDYDREVQKQKQPQNQTQPTPAPDEVLDSINLNDAKNELAFSAEESVTLGESEDQKGLKWTFRDGETVELIGASFDDDGHITWPEDMSPKAKEKFEGHLRLKKLQETGWTLEESELKSNKRWLTQQSQNAIFIREKTKTP